MRLLPINSKWSSNKCAEQPQILRRKYVLFWFSAEIAHFEENFSQIYWLWAAPGPLLEKIERFFELLPMSCIWTTFWSEKADFICGEQLHFEGFTTVKSGCLHIDDTDFWAFLVKHYMKKCSRPSITLQKNAFFSKKILRVSPTLPVYIFPPERRMHNISEKTRFSEKSIAI